MCVMCHTAGRFQVMGKEVTTKERKMKYEASLTSQHFVWPYDQHIFDFTYQRVDVDHNGRPRLLHAEPDEGLVGEVGGENQAREGPKDPTGEDLRHVEGGIDDADEDDSAHGEVEGVGEELKEEGGEERRLSFHCCCCCCCCF